LLGPVRGQSILQIDRGKWRWKLAQIVGRRAHKACELAKAPMCRCNWGIRIGQDQHEALGIVAAGLNANAFAFDDARSAALGPGLYRISEVGKRQISLVGRPIEPFGRDTAHPLAAADINLVASMCITRGRLSFDLSHGICSSAGAGRLSPSPQPAAAGSAPLSLFSA